jgi:hypothetical protein
MQSITIGRPSSYLRLTAVRHPPDSAPEHLPRQRRRYLQAELHLSDVSATCKLDLNDHYAGLDIFFQQVAAHWHEWENTRMVWGMHGGLRLDFERVRGAFHEPEYLILWIKLGTVGFRRRPWFVETSMIIEADELQSIADNLRLLSD